MAGVRCAGTLLTGESQLDLESPWWWDGGGCMFASSYCVDLFIFILKILLTELSLLCK